MLVVFLTLLVPQGCGGKVDDQTNQTPSQHSLVAGALNHLHQYDDGTFPRRMNCVTKSSMFQFTQRLTHPS